MAKQMIEKTGKINLNPILFNGISIVLVLLVLPISLAVISSQNLPEITQEETSLTPGLYLTDNLDPISAYLDNGYNSTNHFRTNNLNDPIDAYSCADIERFRDINGDIVPPDNQFYLQGRCVGEENDAFVELDNGQRNVFPYSTLANIPYIDYPQIYNAGSLPVSQNNNHILPSSQYAENQIFPITFSFINGSGWSLESNGTLNRISIFMHDSTNIYSCSDSRLANMTVEHSIEFIYQGEIRKYEGFKTNAPNFRNIAGSCYSTMNIIFEFDLIQAFEINQFVEGNYDDVSLIIDITSYENDKTVSPANVLMPFHGDGNFEMTFQISAVDTLEVNQLMQTYTIVISLIIGYLAIASTPYYDPLRNLFKGAIE